MERLCLGRRALAHRAHDVAELVRLDRARAVRVEVVEDGADLGALRGRQVGLALLRLVVERWRRVSQEDWAREPRGQEDLAREPRGSVTVEHDRLGLGALRRASSSASAAAEKFDSSTASVRLIAKSEPNVTSSEKKTAASVSDTPSCGTGGRDDGRATNEEDGASRVVRHIAAEYYFYFGGTTDGRSTPPTAVRDGSLRR